MKKFIFGLMLLVSMLGIVGCANNVDDEVYYTVVNKTDAPVKIAYVSKQKSIGNPQTVEVDKSYSVAKSDICIAENDSEEVACFLISSLESYNANGLSINITIARFAKVKDLEKGPVAYYEYTNDKGETCNSFSPIE